eukprot:662259_1
MGIAALRLVHYLHSRFWWAYLYVTCKIMPVYMDWSTLLTGLNINQANTSKVEICLKDWKREYKTRNNHGKNEMVFVAKRMRVKKKGAHICKLFNVEKASKAER